MPSPFPGMDPFLERPGLWSDVHHELITVARAELSARLRPKYIVRIEERVYVADEDEPALSLRIPDVEITTNSDWSGRPSVSAGGGTVELIEPIVATTAFLHRDEVREIHLEVRELPSRSVVTVIELANVSGNPALLVKNW